MRHQRHWQIIIYPEQYDDEDDHGYGWEGVIPADLAASDQACDAFATEAACVDCEAANGWEEGDCDRECSTSDSHAGVEAALRATIANLPPVTAERQVTKGDLVETMIDALQGWEHTFK